MDYLVLAKFIHIFIPVNHSFTAKCMVKAGKEIETAELAGALNLVFDNKVIVYKNRTVVFE